MSNSPKPQRPYDGLPDSYPAEIFIDFVLTQGYTLVEDAPTYTVVKNEETGFTERIHESERDLSLFQIETVLSDMKIPMEAFKEFLREMELKTKESIDFFIDNSFVKFGK